MWSPTDGNLWGNIPLGFQNIRVNIFDTMTSTYLQ